MLFKSAAPTGSAPRALHLSWHHSLLAVPHLPPSCPGMFPQHHLSTAPSHLEPWASKLLSLDAPMALSHQPQSIYDKSRSAWNLVSRQGSHYHDGLVNPDVSSLRWGSCYPCAVGEHTEAQCRSVPQVPRLVSDRTLLRTAMDRLLPSSGSRLCKSPRPRPSHMPFLWLVFPSCRASRLGPWNLRPVPVASSKPAGLGATYM